MAVVVDAAVAVADVIQPATATTTTTVTTTTTTHRSNRLRAFPVERRLFLARAARGDSW